jgi:hypothetical protein
MVNYTTPLDPTNATPEYDGTLCPTGYCHLRASGAIRFSDAYGAGILDAALAVGEATGNVPGSTFSSIHATQEKEESHASIFGAG